MNVIARLEYELAYYDSAVHRFNHYTTRTPPIMLVREGDRWCRKAVDGSGLVVAGVCLYRKVVAGSGRRLWCRISSRWCWLGQESGRWFRKAVAGAGPAAAGAELVIFSIISYQGFGQKEVKIKNNHTRKLHGHLDKFEEEERQWRRGLQKDVLWAIHFKDPLEGPFDTSLKIQPPSQQAPLQSLPPLPPPQYRPPQHAPPQHAPQQHAPQQPPQTPNK